MKAVNEIAQDIEALVRKAAVEYHYFSKLEVEVTRNGADFEIHVQDMYSTPPFNSGLVFDLVEYFGTKRIDSRSFDISGCETCDYGSRYGYDLTVKGSTL